MLRHEDATWPFEGKPCLNVALPGSRWEKVHNLDPFPCYSHDAALVAHVAALCEARFPTKFPTVYAILPFEQESRSNGWATKESFDYDSKTELWSFFGIILLSGKRIPLHPAMTRYLVAHEYGHIADYHLCHARGLQDNGLEKEYAEMRGIPHDDRYGGQRWHTNTGEVIANDFRIAVCGMEREFWPHPFPHPDEVPAVAQWWSDMMLKYCGAPRREEAAA